MTNADNRMPPDRRPLAAGPGLVWGIDFGETGRRDVADCDRPQAGAFAGST